MDKASVMKLRVNEREKQAFEDASKLAGISLSAWARERLRRSARLELDDAGLPVSFLENVRLG